MAIEIVSFPIKNGDFPVRYVKLPEGINQRWTLVFKSCYTCVLPSYLKASEPLLHPFPKIPEKDDLPLNMGH